MRVMGYIRVSTEEQAREGFSLPAQRRKLELYCDLKGLELIGPIEDDGYSAKNMHKRPGMVELLDLMKRRTIDGVVIAKLDRLTRSLRDWSVLIDTYFGERGAIKLFSVGDDINTTSATGRMMLNIVMTVAQWEREINSERTKDGLQLKIARGERCGKIRYGYDLADDGKMLVPNPAEQEVINVIRILSGQGRSLRAIGQALRDMGIKTKEGNDTWLPATINRILKRRSA
jgi:DNA invertase Pin-like site-specific DNA recombinase